MTDPDKLTAMSDESDRATVKPPTDCPCGHPLGGYYMCIGGAIYGPCEDEYCGGVCEETWGACTKGDCACKEDE